MSFLALQPGVRSINGARYGVEHGAAGSGYTTELRQCEYCHGRFSRNALAAVTSTGVWFTPYCHAERANRYVWGETLENLSQAGVSLEQKEGPSTDSEGRARVTEEGKKITKTLWWSHREDNVHFQFDFDEPLSMKIGEQIIVEIGPKHKAE